MSLGNAFRRVLQTPSSRKERPRHCTHATALHASDTGPAPISLRGADSQLTPRTRGWRGTTGEWAKSRALATVQTRTWPLRGGLRSYHPSPRTWG